MGKKNKDKSKFRATPFDYMEGGRISKMGERYGVDKSDYNVGYGRTSGGGRSYKGGREDYEKAIADAAMRDYDTRRTMEAQAMSGKKKARKYAEGGFNNIEDVIKANNMRERWHKKAGGGGSFSSASDFAGQTMRAVERERRKQDAGYADLYATKDALGKLKEDMLSQAKAKKADEPIEYTESDELAAAKGRLNGGGVFSSSDSIFKTAAPLESPTTAFRKENESAPAADDQERAANSYLEQYKQDVVKGGRVRQAFTDNLNNAYNTVIGSDI